MNPISRYIPAIAALLLAATAAIPAHGDDAARLRARYYYLEGARQQAAHNTPGAYAYYKKAYDTDTTYAEAAFSYAMLRLMIQTDTLQSAAELNRSARMMRRYADRYPGDIYENQAYAYIAGRLDSVGESIRIYNRIDSLDPANSTNLLQLADAYMASGRPGDAYNALDRFEVREGSSPQLSLKRIGYKIADGDTVGALALTDLLIADKPSDPTWWMVKGNLFELSGQNDSVLAAYRHAETIDPDNGNIKLELAKLHKQLGDSTAYHAKIYEAILSEDFELDDKLTLMGEYLQSLLDDRTDTARGDHLFDVVKEQYPHEPQVLALSAAYNAAKGDVAQAIEDIQYVTDLEPSEPKYWMQLMRYQLVDGRGEDAMATYARASAHVQPDDNMKFAYASAATAAGKYGLAKETYGQLIHNIEPSLPLTEAVDNDRLRRSLPYNSLAALSTLYNQLGDMYHQAGSLDSTYMAYENSLYFYPENAMVLNNYAYFLAEGDGDLDRALQMSRAAVEKDPENPTYLDTYAWVLFKRKEYTEALEMQNKAMEINRANGTNEESAEFYSHLGDIQFMNHMPAEAVENWKKALKLDPDDKLLQKKVSHKTFFFE